jgi:hypothetical protein
MMQNHPNSAFCTIFSFPVKGKAATLLLTTVLILTHSVSAFDIPGIYRCRAVRLTQMKKGRKYSKAFQTGSLYMRVTRNEVRVFGTHSKLSACRRLRIRYRELDTLFLESPEEVALDHSEPKLYMVKDTVMGNVNLFDTDTSEISVKMIVKKLRSLPPAEIEKYCK